MPSEFSQGSYMCGGTNFRQRMFICHEHAHLPATLGRQLSLVLSGIFSWPPQLVTSS